MIKRGALVTLCVLVFPAFLLQTQASDPETWPVVYQDDFEDPGSGWLTGDTEYVSGAYVAGTYKIQVKNDWLLVLSRIPGDQEYLDFAAEVTFWLEGGEGEAGFLFRYQNTGNYYCFTVSTRGEYGLWRKREGKWETLIAWTPVTALNLYGANKLRLVAQGNTFMLHLNEVLLGKYTDPMFRIGQLGICVGTFERPSITVKFDNLVVREDPEIRVLATRAQILYDQAESAYSDWDLQRAIAGFQEALSLYQRLEWEDKKADCYLRLGNCWYIIGNIHRAIEQHRQALAIYQQIGNPKGEAVSLNNLGNCYYSLGDYQRAIDYHEESLAIKREIGDRRGEAASLNNIGLCYEALGDYQQAIDYYEKSLAIKREIGDRWGEASSTNNLGFCYRALGDYQRAIDYLEESLAISREIGDRRGEAASLNNIGLCYEALGDYQRAIDYYEESLAIKREIGDRRGEAQSLNNLGNCYYSLGDYQQAIDYYEKSLAIKREIGDRRGEATSLNNIGLCYDSLGDYQRAIDYHEESLAIKREIGDRQGEANSLGNLGNCYYSLGDYRRAIDYYERSLAIEREIGDRRGEAATLNNLGLCYELLGDYQRAIDYYKGTLAIMQEIGDRWGEAASLINLSLCYHFLGDHRRAIEYYQECLQIVQGFATEEGYLTGASETLWRLHYGLGSSYQAVGELLQAVQEWKRAVEAIEWMRGRLARAEFKAGFMGNKHFVYRELVLTLVELGAPDEGVFYAERAKARTLVDMMETAMVQEPLIVPAALQTASQLLRQLETAQAAEELPTSLSGERAGLERAAQRAREELEEFLSHLSRANPVLSDTLSVDPDRIASYMEDVQGNLGAGEIILEYFVAGEETILWVITEDGIQTAARIQIPRADLAEKVRALREELNEVPDDEGEKVNSMLRARQLGKELYDLLIAPVEDYLQAASHLVIVPSDVLFY
ncbi:hypothetical protein DRN74_06395, partial [Candidatus Micrarchaeota archaeon]